MFECFIISVTWHIAFSFCLIFVRCASIVHFLKTVNQNNFYRSLSYQESTRRSTEVL